MKHVIIGTAGHVDHGKTALVKALTGIDTDRLKEEKRRGVTIELGFAYIDFEDGTRAGVIDVPGHERFIRNMLAGAGGIDLAMLVVAADEGVMPQTREHLGILAQLGIKNGITVITKSDKADADWIEMVTEDIASLVKGTFLEGKQTITVSAHTGEGLPELRGALHGLVETAGEKDFTLPFRLPVDRVFPVDGFGIVVTGTLIEGSINVGDVAEIFPSGQSAPARSIQVHGGSVETACAGQRTAISLAGVKRGSVSRGDVIAAKGSLNVTTEIDVRLTVLPGSGRTIKQGAELHLYHGTRTALVKAALLDSKELLASQSCYARLKLKEPLPCKRGDRFVVRFYSPLETIGGGVILASKPAKRVSRTKAALEALKIREQGSAEEIAALAAAELGRVFTVRALCRQADLSEQAIPEAITPLVASGKIIRLAPEKYISQDTLKALCDACTRLLGSYHTMYPLRPGMNIAELRQKLTPDYDISDASAVLNALKDNGTIKLLDKDAALPGFEIEMTPDQSRIRARIQKIFQEAGFDTPSPDELASQFDKSERNGFGQTLESMKASGDVVALSPQIFWGKESYDKAVIILKGHFEEEKEITLAQCRDMLKTSRKYALAFLEYLDRIGATRKTGETRIIAKGF